MKFNFEKIIGTAGALAASAGLNAQNPSSEKLLADNSNEIVKEHTINVNNENTADENMLESEEVSDVLRKDWNKYVDWLEKKGMKGAAELDHNDLGGQMIDQYLQELQQKNLTTTLSRDKVRDIQEEFRKYREWALGRVHAGKVVFDEGTNEENYMKSLSIVDNIAGQRTTSFKFPDMYLQYKHNGLLKKIEKQGFSKAGKAFNPDPKMVSYEELVKAKDNL